MLNVNLTLPKFNKISIRLIKGSLLAGIGLSFGLIPDMRARSQVATFSINAYAQEFTPQETQSYAKAGYEVELLRREVYQEIKSIINQPPPNIVCDRQETLQDLDPDIRNLANRYCSESLQIVRQNNLSIDRFNELKSYYDRRDNFYQQVQKVLLKLQN